MKIVRITIKVGGSQFFFDRAYDPDKKDMENCDAALKHLQTLMSEGKTLAAMIMTGGVSVMEDGKLRHDPYLNACPAILNFAHIPMVAIENAGVYEAEDKGSDE